MFQISSYLACETIGFKGGIKISSDILTYHVRKKGEQRCRYKLVQWNSKRLFDIFNYISDYVPLV